MTPAQLAANDEPLRALELAAATGDSATAAAMQQRLAHLRDAQAYAAFYNEYAAERPWMPLERVPECHQSMPRFGLIWQQIMLHQHRDVLELGCMDGFVALNLAMHGRFVQGVDVNRAAIAEASARATHFGVVDRVRFHAGMIEDVALDERFDAVLVMEVLEHVRDVDAVLAVAEHHVRPDGRIYVSAPLTAPRHQHEREAREHVRLFTHAAMLELLMARGRELVFYTQLPTPDGLHHCGAYRIG